MWRLNKNNIYWPHEKHLLVVNLLSDATELLLVTLRVFQSLKTQCIPLGPSATQAGMIARKLPKRNIFKKVFGSLELSPWKPELRHSHNRGPNSGLKKISCPAQIHRTEYVLDSCNWLNEGRWGEVEVIASI